MKTVTIMKGGMLMHMMIIAPTTLHRIKTNFSVSLTRVLSMVLTSLEKRFNMRPSGVVSYTDMGALMARDNIMLCDVKADWVAPIVNITMPIAMKTPEKKWEIHYVSNFHYDSLIEFHRPIETVRSTLYQSKEGIYTDSHVS